jgi:epoxyqueuosine reductase
VAEVTAVDNVGARIVERAKALGFASVGIVPVGPLPHLGEFEAWLDAGYHGEMRWLARDPARRATATSVLPGARSIIAVTALYHAGEQAASVGAGRIAAYARGYDYHRVLEERLSRLAGFVRAETGAEVGARAAVDRLPLLERDVAALAGLGWQGKNTMILDRSLGSFFFLAELVVEADLSPVGAEVRDHCGTCTACLDACPTGAFVAPYVLDARLCISYLTIEHRGPIPRALRPLIGDYLFGCDICQDVCPWNRKAPATTEFAFLGRPDVEALTADQLLMLSEAEFRERLELSPLQRAQRPGLLRNAAVVLGNSGEGRWVPLLSHVLRTETEPLVRGHAAWALGELGGRWASRALAVARKTESAPYVIEEIEACLE